MLCPVLALLDETLPFLGALNDGEQVFAEQLGTAADQTPAGKHCSVELPIREYPALHPAEETSPVVPCVRERWPFVGAVSTGHGFALHTGLLELHSPLL